MLRTTFTALMLTLGAAGATQAEGMRFHQALQQPGSGKKSSKCSGAAVLGGLRS